MLILIKALRIAIVTVSFIMVTLIIYGFYVRYKSKIKMALDKLRYIPKKVSYIYKFEYFPGGAYFNCKKNSIEAFNYAVQLEGGFQIDLQFSLDNIAYCFPHRYMLKLTGIPGKFSHISSKNLKKHYMRRFEIVELKRILEVNFGKTPIIISISGNIRKEDIRYLLNLLKRYNGVYALEISNIFTYIRFKFKRQFSNIVIFKHNILRKKIEYIDNKYCEIINPEISSVEILLAIEDSLKLEKISERLFHVFSKCTSRINSSSSILNRPIVHRGIIDSSKYGEHEVESACETVRRGCIYEGDITRYKNKLVWYHSDKFSGIVIKQPSSVAEKIAIENAPTLEDTLEAISNLKDLKLHPAIIIDIKDARTFNRSLEKKLLESCEKYKDKIEIYFSYYNPMIGKWLFKNNNEYRRVAVYNSLEGIKWLTDPIRVAISAILSNDNKSDAGNWNIGPKGNAILFSKFVQKSSANVNFVYAPKNEAELDMFKVYFVNWVVEDVANQELWANTFDYHDDGIISLKKNDLSDN